MLRDPSLPYAAEGTATANAAVRAAMASGAEPGQAELAEAARAAPSSSPLLPATGRARGPRKRRLTASDRCSRAAPRPGDARWRIGTVRSKR
jgi:hypothetical protein